MNARRVWVLGLDGATFDVILPLVESGQLPGFKALMERGAWGPLESVPNMRSAAAWTTFQTGTNPGKHGIYEFYDYLPECYGLRYIHADSRDGPSLWHLISRHDRQVGVINVPMTYPAEEVNGFLIAGLDCPSTESPGFTYPAGLAEEIRQTVGDYQIEPGVTGAIIGGRIEEAATLLRREMSQKIDLARQLSQTHSWDCFVCILRSLDAVQHAFWKYSDARHPDYQPDAAKLHGHVIPDTYRLIDGYLQELIAGLDDRTTLVVMSDHGFGPKQGATVQINRWLAAQGWLTWRPARAQSSASLLRQIYRFLVGRTSRRFKERLWQALPTLRDRVQSRLCFTGIDWRRTQAYSDSLFANIRVNLEGRERDGIVKPGEEYAQLLDRIETTARAMRDSETDTPIVADVLRPAQCYQGPHRDRAPDLLIRWREDIPVHGIHFPPGTPAGPTRTVAVPGEDPRLISGDHQLHGIFMAMGPDVAPGKRLDGARLLDVAPTLLHQMRLPIPTHMDGEPLALQDGETPEALPPIRRETVDTQTQRPRESGYSAGEAEQIHQRLRDLGYVE